jgi:hypothetical protein
LRPQRKNFAGFADPSSLSDLNALPGYWVESPDRF